MSRYTVKGTTTDITECELCGRDDLRGTVVFEAVDADGTGTGEFLYAGSDCAARVTGQTAGSIRTQAARADRAATEAALDAYTAECERITEEWETRYRGWLRAQFGTDDERLRGPLVSRPRERAALRDRYKAETGDRPVYPARPGDTTDETPEETPVLPLFDPAQLPGQTTIDEMIEAALADTPAPAAAPELPGDGSLFALRVTDTPTTDGALFGLTI